MKKMWCPCKKIGGVWFCSLSLRQPAGDENMHKLPVCINDIPGGVAGLTLQRATIFQSR